ncbi:hypothetical protein [Microvirga aerophila]|nr:hypothetical protein [Microvirga aerophila]
MSRSFVTHRPSTPVMHDACYPDDLLPQLQATLAALADAEVRYESAREHLEAWAGPEVIRPHLLAQLEGHYQHECEWYAHRLADLHRQVRATMGL